MVSNPIWSSQLLNDRIQIDDSFHIDETIDIDDRLDIDESIEIDNNIENFPSYQCLWITQCPHTCSANLLQDDHRTIESFNNRYLSSPCQA